MIRPLGQVTLKTRIDGEEYQLVFIVIPNVSPEDKMIIGDPLRDQATILLGREEASVTRHASRSSKGGSCQKNRSEAGRDAEPIERCPGGIQARVAVFSKGL